jgi:tetratricopeptide (TPR) repeat protein
MAIYDFNLLEETAAELITAGKVADAIKIYIFMADGDPSLDAGYLGTKLGECYELLGDLHAAKYWHGRAVEENPEVRTSSAGAVKRLTPLSGIDHLLPGPTTAR